MAKKNKIEFKCDRENCPYKEKIILLEYEIEQLRQMIYKSHRKKPFKNSSRETKKPKKKGILGHIGWFRKKPKKIDEVKEIEITRCPECNGKDLKECQKIDEHIQEDIILPEVKTTLYRRHHYYCKTCRKIVTAKGDNELKNSYIGPKAKALAVFMKYTVKISDRDIKEIFNKVFNLKIALSSIIGFREQLKRESNDIYERLKKRIRKSSFVHADETGWRIDGKNSWLWKFSDKKICITHIDKSRGQKVVEEILGKEYDGTLITDFWAAYNKITTKSKQKCLVHILRDIKKVVEYWHDDEEVIRYCKQLKKILEKGIKLHKEYKDRKWDKRYYRMRELIVQQLRDFDFPNPNKKILIRFAKRLKRYKEEIFTFLYIKNIDFHNNHIEQQIRPAVIFRKITFGNRSDKGVKNHSVLMSILQTAQLNKLDPVKTLEKILVNKNSTLLERVLSPP